MGEQGFLGTSIAAEKGGIGGTFKDEAIVLEEQIYANCHAPATYPAPMRFLAFLLSLQQLLLILR